MTKALVAEITDGSQAVDLSRGGPVVDAWPDGGHCRIAASGGRQLVRMTAGLRTIFIHV